MIETLLGWREVHFFWICGSFRTYVVDAFSQSCCLNFLAKILLKAVVVPFQSSQDVDIVKLDRNKRLLRGA